MDILYRFKRKETEAVPKLFIGDMPKLEAIAEVKKKNKSIQKERMQENHDWPAGAKFFVGKAQNDLPGHASVWYGDLVAWTPEEYRRAIVAVGLAIIALAGIAVSLVMVIWG